MVDTPDSFFPVPVQWFELPMNPARWGFLPVNDLATPVAATAAPQPAAAVTGAVKPTAGEFAQAVAEATRPAHVGTILNERA